jgi:hypothetical protein
VSNRIIGLHVGAKGNITSSLGFRILATHARHYGTYYNTSYFTPAKKQTYLLCELPYRFNKVYITAAVGNDFGDLTNNTSGMLRVEYRIW